MPILDLSHPIRPGMPVYPGTEPPLFEPGSSLERDGFLEKRITLFSHTGTHMDAPAHILPGAPTLDHFPVDHFSGAACVADVAGARVGVGALEGLALWRGQVGFVLLRSGWSRHWGEPDYFSGFPVLEEAAARWLAAWPGLKGIGVDMISVDAVHSTTFPIHRLLLSAGLVIVENLRGLEQLPAAPFGFSCFPLPLAEADGAPVRAVAHVEGERHSLSVREVAP